MAARRPVLVAAGLAVLSAASGAWPVGDQVAEVSQTTPGPPTTPPPPRAERLERTGLLDLVRAGRLLLSGPATCAGLAGSQDRGLVGVIELRVARGKGEGGLDGCTVRLGLDHRVLEVPRSGSLADDLFEAARDSVRTWIHRAPDSDGDPGARRPKTARDGAPTHGDTSGATDRTTDERRVLITGEDRNRTVALWTAVRTLDQGLPWVPALGEARELGLEDPEITAALHHYVLGAGNQALGEVKLRIRRDFPDVPALSVSDLDARLSRPGPAPVLLDVRAPREYAVSHLAGARRADDLTTARALVPDPASEIVAYCSVGMRSAHLVRRLRAAGYTNVRNLEGSLFEWANSGRAVYRGAERVEVVHPFDAKWGRLLARRYHPR